MNLRSRFAMAASVAVAAQLFHASPGFGQQPIPCGTTVTRSVTLRANIGPCNQTALRVPLGYDHVTVDLNGYRILGTGASGSAGIEVRSGMATIQGQGTITGFDTGIQIIAPGAWWEPRGTTVQRVHLEANRTGIWIVPDQYVEAYGLNRILRNTITGPGRTGIRVERSDQAEIDNNTIAGQDEYGILTIEARHATITGNTVTRNNTGIFLNYWSDQAVVRGNDVNDNRLDGIVSGGRNPLLQGNTASRNGRDGMLLTQFLGRVLDNRADNNGRRGISVSTFDPGPGAVSPDTYHVTGNDARNNVADLFWDLSGKRNCWADNKFRTSTPAQLPACP